MRIRYPTIHEPTAIPPVTRIRASITVQLTVGRTGTFFRLWRYFDSNRTRETETRHDAMLLYKTRTRTDTTFTRRHEDTRWCVDNRDVVVKTTTRGDVHVENSRTCTHEYTPHTHTHTYRYIHTDKRESSTYVNTSPHVHASVGKIHVG